MDWTGDGLGVGSCVVLCVWLASDDSASVHSLSHPTVVGVPTRTLSGMHSVQSSPCKSSRTDVGLSWGVSAGEGKILLPGTSVQKGSDNVQSSDAPGVSRHTLDNKGAE